MPEDETASGVLFDREEIELGAELAMVAPPRFFQPREILLELRAIVPGRAVDSLQHWPVLVAAPVGAGDARQFERADSPRRIGVAAAAKIGELPIV